MNGVGRKGDRRGGYSVEGNDVAHDDLKDVALLFGLFATNATLATLGALLAKATELEVLNEVIRGLQTEK